MLALPGKYTLLILIYYEIIQFLVVRSRAGAYKRVLLVDQLVDAEVGVDEDDQGDHELHHGLQNGVVEQFIIESKLFTECRENLYMQTFWWNCSFLVPL